MASPSLSPVSELCQITIARLPTTTDHHDDDDDHAADDHDNHDDDEVGYKTELTSEKAQRSTLCTTYERKVMLVSFKSFED